MHAPALTLLACALSTLTAAAQKVPVSFVGCPSDGQLGPQPAPNHHANLPTLPSAIAAQLAYYAAAQGPAILAPRGWTCFAQYGSDGDILYVAPQPITFDLLVSSRWQGFPGPAIEVFDMSGQTSGRFTVARLIARVFPAHRRFVENVIAEQIEPASRFPFGPFPHDKLTYKGPNTVEYETPAHTYGLGAASRLLKSDQPIRGVAILQPPDMDCLQLSARLPANLAALTPTIIQQLEQDTK